MAKKFIKISLGIKFLLFYGAAMVAIIVTALAVPWFFVELLAEQGVESPAAELTRLRLNEWILAHPDNPDARSSITQIYTAPHPSPGRSGPTFISFQRHPELEDDEARQARDVLTREAGQTMVVLPSEDEQGREVFRCFRAVRIATTCMECHGPPGKAELRYALGQLVGMIDLRMPREVAYGPLTWYARGAFVAGALLAGVLALVLLTIITRRLVLRPVRQLRDVADKAAEGDLSIRTSLRSEDELQHLGESFNDMLEAIAGQHSQLRAANRALDQKLRDLSEANVALFEANKVKSEFLANISHELRTPLNSIIGFADLMADAPDDRVARYGQNISSSAKHLLNMINDLLDLAKIEAGRAEIRFDQVAVTDTCQTLIALTKPLADKKQLSLNTDFAADVPIIVTDGGKFQQILYNLLSNAIKFTPTDGAVTVAVKAHTGARGNGPREEVSISVADSGPGISEADQKHIFEKFYQADRTITKGTPGTGLGLAIARELTNLLGGRLELESSPGHGATFTVTLPVDGRRAAEQTGRQAAQTNGPDP